MVQNNFKKKPTPSRNNLL